MFTSVLFVYFYPYNKQHVTIKINKKALSEEKHVKYLGVLIDSSLQWKPHILNLSKKITRDLGVMYRVHPFITLTIMKNLYYSLVYPHLLYGIQAWGFGFQTDLNKLIILQKKTVRMMTFNDISLGIRGPLPHSAPIFKELSILRINDILKIQVTCFIYDTLLGLSPIQFKSWFKFCIDVHDHATRNATIVNNDEGTVVFVFEEVVGYDNSQIN